MSFYKKFSKNIASSWRATPKIIRNILVTLVAFLLFLLGIIGTILPFLPGTLFYLLAIIVLSSEFSWAENYKKKILKYIKKLKKKK